MLENIPKISVLIITYNQENVIRRTIESLLSQKDYIYEICVSDDCSKDKTWDVLQEYSINFPGLFVLNRNESNIGIFENNEKTWTMPKGDVIYQVAGDDECGPGWFKKVVDFIAEKKIDYKNELFCIYGDYIGVNPVGRRTLHRNNLCVTNKNIFSLSLRVIISSRSTCFSAKILKKYFKVSQGRSHIAEGAMDRQLQLFTEKIYYIPSVGNIYYSGIGESTRINNEETVKARKMINRYMVNAFANKGYRPTKADLRYIEYDDAFMDFLYQRTLGNGVKLFWKWLLSYDPSIGIRSLKLDFIKSQFKKAVGNIVLKIRQVVKKTVLIQGYLFHRNIDSKVLYYHDVGLKYTDMGTPIETIKKHIDVIRATGFEIVEEICDKEGQVMIAFDDGWSGIYDEKQYFVEEKIHPTIFVAVDLIGTSGHLTVSQIKELSAIGFRFETHSWSHDDLTICDKSELIHELIDSKYELEKMLSMRFDAVCYPRGYYNEEVIKCAKDAGYKRQFSSIWGGYYDRLYLDGVICRMLAQDLSDRDVKYTLLGSSPFLTRRYIKQHLKKSNYDGRND